MFCVFFLVVVCLSLSVQRSFGQQFVPGSLPFSAITVGGGPYSAEKTRYDSQRDLNATFATLAAVGARQVQLLLVAYVNDVASPSQLYTKNDSSPLSSPSVSELAIAVSMARAFKLDVSVALLIDADWALPTNCHDPLASMSEFSSSSQWSFNNVCSPSLFSRGSLEDRLGVAATRRALELVYWLLYASRAGLRAGVERAAGGSIRLCARNRHDCGAHAVESVARVGRWLAQRAAASVALNHAGLSRTRRCATRLALDARLYWCLCRWYDVLYLYKHMIVDFMFFAALRASSQFVVANSSIAAQQAGFAADALVAQTLSSTIALPIYVADLAVQSRPLW